MKKITVSKLRKPKSLHDKTDEKDQPRKWTRKRSRRVMPFDQIDKGNTQNTKKSENKLKRHSN